MNSPRCDDVDYIDFLIASPRHFTCTEAARSQPSQQDDKNDASASSPAHDSFTRLLQRLPQDTRALWDDAKKVITVNSGVLIIDDTTLDKPYAEKMDYVTYHWSGKHHAVVKGINLITTLWSDGTALIPCDFRLYNASKDGLTKNDHFRSMLLVAKQRGMEPNYILFDSWLLHHGEPEAHHARAGMALLLPPEGEQTGQSNWEEERKQASQRHPRRDTSRRNRGSSQGIWNDQGVQDGFSEGRR